MKHFFFPVTALLLMIGCSNLKQPPSAIVKRAEACGAGDLSATSGPALQDWFGKHRDCAVAVDALCKPVREKAAAAWSDSSEGQRLPGSAEHRSMGAEAIEGSRDFPVGVEVGSRGKLTRNSGSNAIRVPCEQKSINIAKSSI